jgi:16S rRNA processing protein RimM
LSQTPPYLAIGRIGRPHGVQGEVRIEVLTDFPERFAPGARLFVGPAAGAEPQPAAVVTVRTHGDRLLVRFDIAADRDAAGSLTNQLVFIPTAEARPLGPDAYYPHELEGMTVVTAAGRELGRVGAVMETGSAEVLVVREAGREHLIPMIADIIDTVDLAAGRIVITPLPGLLDEEE